MFIQLQYFQKYTLRETKFQSIGASNFRIKVPKNVHEPHETYLYSDNSDETLVISNNLWWF